MPLNRIASYLSWVILLVLAVPSVLVLASWNALPGDLMYPVKRGMEDLLLTAVSPSKDLSAQLSVKYSERRFSEATSLLTEKHSIVGLAYFEQQMQQAQQKIAQTTDPVAQNQLKTQLVSNLVSYQEELATTKEAIAQTAPAPTSGSATQTTKNPSAGINTQITATVTPLVPVINSANAIPTVLTKSQPASLPTQPATQTPTGVKTAPTTASQQGSDNNLSIAPSLSNSVSPVSNQQMVEAITQTQTQISQTIKELEKDNNSKGQDNKNNKEEQQMMNNDTEQQKRHQKNKRD